MLNEVQSKSYMWIGIHPSESSSTEQDAELTGEYAIYKEERPQHVQSLPKDPELGPASVILETPDEDTIILQWFLRAWNSEKGFYYRQPLPRLEAPQPVWSAERWKQENELIAATGVDPFSVTLPLVCDVKNEQNPINYVSPQGFE
jgi:hypothetical protein